MVDKDVRFEAMSVLLGANVKPRDKRSRQTAITLEQYISAAIAADGSQSEFFVDIDSFFDSKYDYDFTNSSSQQFNRGGESYNRPIGWYRIALKVKDKYPDGNTWLGPAGLRGHSSPGEWPVAYHGTSMDAAKGILHSHYKAGDGQKYGRGVYVTPCLDTASKYTKMFTSKKNGKRYRVVMQNRINPLMRELASQKKKYWLIPIAKHLSSQQEREIVKAAIRPYGILIQEVSDSEHPEPESDSD